MSYAPHRTRRLVLVVDDDDAVRATVRTLLESMDFLVSTASDAGEAIAEIGAQRPDVILTDLLMPEGNGYELIAALRAFGEAIPLIAMSGGAVALPLRTDLELATRLGVDAVIAKPFRRYHLVETIDRAIAGRLAA